jgi:hypothetical protein
MSWDVALPSDSKELPIYLESEDKVIFEQYEGNGDTLFLCCEYDRCGGWNTVKTTYIDTEAEAWFDEVE